MYKSFSTHNEDAVLTTGTHYLAPLSGWTVEQLTDLLGMPLIHFCKTRKEFQYDWHLSFEVIEPAVRADDEDFRHYIAGTIYGCNEDLRVGGKTSQASFLINELLVAARQGQDLRRAA